MCVGGGGGGGDGVGLLPLPSHSVLTQHDSVAHFNQSINQLVG